MLGINSELSFFYILLCVFIGLIYAYFLYFTSKKKDLKINLVYTLFILRSSFVSILAFLLLNPVLISNVKNIEKPIIVIAKDVSQSIKEDINDLDVLLGGLNDFELLLYSFSEKVYDGFDHNNTGLKTNYSYLFSDLDEKLYNRNVAGVIIASDGCYNAGLNPEYLSYDFPIYSIALGDTTIYKDIRVADVLKNDIAFLGNNFPLEISIASNVKQRESTKLNIYNDGQKVYETIVNLSEEINYNTYNISLPANKIGLQTYTIELESLDDEKNIINNVFDVYIDVIDSRFNILVLKEGNSPDLAAYKSSVEKNQNFKIEVKNITDQISPDKYQLVAIFDVDNIPSSLIDTDVPLIIFNVKDKHYKDLNSKISFYSEGIYEQAILYKNDSFSKFIFSKELLSLIADAPPLHMPFGKYNFVGNIDFVLNQKLGDIETEKPVIMIQYLDSRKICFVLAEGWWRWKIYDYSLNNGMAFNELFLKLSQYLLLQEDKSLFRLEYEKQYEENSEILLHALLYNESYELVNNKKVSLILTDDKDQQYNFQFINQGDQLIVNIGSLEVGNYSFIAQVEGTNLVKKGVFDVKKIQLEQLGLSANHQVLHKIANLSKGKVFHQDGMYDLLQEIKNSERNNNIIHLKEQFQALINIPWILLILLMMICTEWFVRRYNGLI